MLNKILYVVDKSDMPL